MTILVAIGWNNTGALAPFSWQPPKIATITPGRRQRGGDMLVYIDGYYRTALIYGYLTKAIKTAILSELGLTSAESAKITLQLPGRDRDTDQTWNAVVEHDVETEFYNKWLENVFPVILVEDITT
jgi:hypothetical protein